MPSRCVIGGCSHTHRDGVSLHIFPKDQARKKLWVKFVKLTRSDFSFQTHKRPLICSDHFSPESYVERMKYCDEGSQRVLSEVAVPSIKSGSDLEKKKERYVVQKREGLVIASGFSHDEASSSQQTPIYQNYDP
uniref:THAP domain-containing protein 2-like n=1 Tax=Styela clava TaxID=7725 RepID=UPI00193A3B8D|nr:THAP domain-containing protein 2-like [Styela clava]